MPGFNFGESGDVIYQSDSPVNLRIAFLSAVINVAQELLPPGSLSRGITILYHISSGPSSIGIGGVAWVNKPAAGTSTAVVTIQAGDTYTFSVPADGSLTVIRSAGTFSSQVTCLLLWA